MVLDMNGEGVKVAKKLEDFVNHMGNEEGRKDFVEYITEYSHRTLQQNMMGLFLKCIEAWSNKGEYEFDLRNQATVEASKKIMKALDSDVRLPFI